MSVDIAAEVGFADGGFRLRVVSTLAAPATGVFGPSGAGKTTLLQLIAGLVRPAVGRVVVDGEVLDDTAAGIHVPVHRRRIGVVFQHGRLLPHLSVDGNLRYGERLLAAAQRRIGYADVVALLALGPLLARRPATLSGGERQRVALGRALLASPRLLLLDEPLAGLDGGLKRQILPFLRRVHSALGIPTIHVSHDLGEVLQLTTDLLLLEGGAVVARGTVAQLAAQPEHLGRLHDLGLVNALPGTVAGHAPEDGLTSVTLGAERTVLTALRDEPVGTACVLLIRPADLVLARTRVVAISMQNQWLGRVVSITGTVTRTVVAVDVGVTLLVEISRRAVAELELAPGAPVWCLCKAQSVLVT